MGVRPGLGHAVEAEALGQPVARRVEMPCTQHHLGRRGRNAIATPSKDGRMKAVSAFGRLRPCTPG